LNRYFVYKKIRVVNTNAIELELSEYNETSASRDMKETKHVVKIAEEVDTKFETKVRKLSKKMLLLPATEAIDEQQDINKSEPVVQPKKIKKNVKVKAQKAEKKIIIIESDEED
jgi:hypothetical protein